MSDAEIFNKLLGIVPVTIFLALVGAVILFLAFVGAVTLIKRRNFIGNELANDARAKIERHYKKGEMFSVIYDCKTELRDCPNDVLLHWYLALASYAEKDYETARTHFKKAGEIDPRYESEALPFLEKIEAEWKPKLVN